MENKKSVLPVFKEIILFLIAIVVCSLVPGFYLKALTGFILVFTGMAAVSIFEYIKQNMSDKKAGIKSERTKKPSADRIAATLLEILFISVIVVFLSYII